MVGRSGGRIARRSSAASVMAVVLVLLAAVAPVLAVPPKLSDPTVTPRSGTTATTIRFEIRYSRPTPPDAIVVRVGGTAHAMSRIETGEWPGSGTFRYEGRFPAGTHDVVFEASGVRDLAAGTIAISPPPTPAPTPTPKATPTPKPTPTPTPVPTSTSAPPSAPAPIATPTPTAPLPTGTGAPTPNTVPDGAGAPVPSAPPVAPPSEPPASPTPETAAPAVVVPAPDGDGTPVGPSPSAPSVPWSPEGAVLAALGLDGPRLPPIGIVPAAVTSTGAVTSAMALSLFGKRRRDDDASEADTLAARAADGVGIAAGDVPRSAVVADAAGPGDIEAGMPRWRRPSLLQARKADPIRAAGEAPRLTFDEALVGSLEGCERRLIRYRLVTLLDAPDEVRGNQLGYLDQGDEVVLLESRGVHRLVLCPDGTRGWLHKMTLGDLVEAGPDGAGGGAPRATMPDQADSWTLAETEGDDVLSSYLAARRRA